MRLTGILILAACMQVSAHGYGQGKLSLSEKDAPLEKVFKDIQKQTNYYFLYHEDILSDSKKVSLEVHEMGLEDVLRLCFKDQPLTYSIVSNSIVVQAKMLEENVPVYTSPTVEGHDVTGVITDEDGSPIASGTITIKGTKIQIVTNEKGEFLLKHVDLNSVILVTSIGYETFEISLKGKTNISIHLKRKIGLLDETVFKGYYSTTKRLNTGDVSTVTSKDIEEQTVSDPLAALEGRVPGLFITASSGAPGTSNNVQLRGQNSIANGNDPLYIIDGVPFITNSAIGTVIRAASDALSPFNSINPADIESIQVLKDADATAIYGSRGANGVILVTTKKGKVGHTKVDLNVYSGAGEITRMMNLLNTPQYLEMRHEAYKNDGVSTLPANAYDINGTWDSTRYTNWQKVFIGGTAHYTDAEGSVSGGNINTQFLIGAGYHKETTVYPGNFYDQRGSVHINLTHMSDDKKFKTSFSAFYTLNDNLLPSNDLSGYVLTPPDAPSIYNSNGQLNWQNSTWTNPYSYQYVHSTSITNNLNSNLNLSYSLLPGLQLASNFGYNYIEANNKLITPLISFNPAITTSQSSNQLGTISFGSWIIEPQLNYQKRIKKGRLEALVGGTFFNQVNNSLVQTGTGFTTDALLQNIQDASKITIKSVGYSLYRYDAVYGRINYDWNEKYVINLTARRDGSSRFGPGKQFGDFGALGVGWIFSKEKWVQDALPFLDFGKLRASYGTTGNDQIGDYKYLNTYTTESSTTQGIVGLYPTALSNADYAWEVNKKLEGGIDLEFLKGRLLLSGSYYRNRSSNQLLQYTLPAITGFSSVIQNLPAIVQNTGLEFTLNTININTRDFRWTSSANITIPENKLVSFPNLISSSYSSTYVIGKSLFIRELYHNTGVNDTTGIYKFQDYNKDGMISSTYDKKDIVFVGEQFYGGLENRLQYKDWQLSFLFQFTEEKHGSNFFSVSNKMPGTMFNQSSAVLDRWQDMGQNTPIQKFSNSNSAASTAFNNYVSSNSVYTNASYIRLRNLSLSYQLPETWKRKARLQNARIYVQGQNIFTITRYLGLDPEDKDTLPPLRVLTAGIQLTF